MKDFLKGVATLVIVMIVNMIIHVLCNTQGIDLNSTVTSIVSTICALAIYHVLTRNDK